MNVHPFSQDGVRLKASLLTTAALMGLFIATYVGELDPDKAIVARTDDRYRGASLSCNCGSASVSNGDVD